MERRLEARKREVTPRPSLHRTRQGEAFGVAPRRLPLDQGAAGKAQAQHLGCLVEGLADGIVDGGAETAIAPHPFDDQQLAMATRDQQHQIRKSHVVGKPRRQGVPLQVVDCKKRQVMDSGNGLGRGHPDQEAADETRPGGGGDAVQLSEFDLRFGQGLGNQAVDVVKVGSCRDLGYDAAEGAVFIDLGQHPVGYDVAFAIDDGGGGFVATGFNSEDDHRKALPVPGR